VKIGFHLPQWGRDATRDGVLEVARTVEEVGLDSVWVADHVVFPTATASRYPYRAETPFTPQDGFLEALTVLAAVAGVTERVLLGTSVLVMPMRNPVLTAKVVSTIDVLSNGRTILALGAGWWEEEFVALEASFEGRGRRFDEQIRLMRNLWTHGTASFQGEFYAFDELACEPRPLQLGGPPLLIGGMGKPAWRRAVALGDGWHAVGVHERTLEQGMKAMARLAEESGRDAAQIRLSTSTVLPTDQATALRRLIRLARMGASHVVLDAATQSATETCRAIETFAKTILPRLRDEVGSSGERT